MADEHLVGRSDMAMQQLAAAGADVFLAGHLHVSHVGHSAQRYQIAGHSALVVQAGTMSTRRRGEPSTMNVLRVAPTRDRDRALLVGRSSAVVPGDMERHVSSNGRGMGVAATLTSAPIATVTRTGISITPAANGRLR